MPSYTFQINKSDHINADSSNDLHLHVFYNEGKSRKILGRYRLPSLEPIFTNTPELTGRELNALRKWISEPSQIRKIRSCLNDTLFDIHKVIRKIPEFNEVKVEKDGETYINIRIPVSPRI